MKPIILIPLLAMLCGCDEKSVAEYRRKEEAMAAQEAKVQADIAELNRRFDALEKRVLQPPQDMGSKIAWEIVHENEALRRERQTVEKIYERFMQVEEVKKMQSITINGVEINVAKVLEDALNKMTEGAKP